MGIEMKMLAMVFFLGIQFCNVCTAVAADDDTEEVDVVASKTKDTCSMEKSPASSRISIVIGKFENKSEMPDSMLGYGLPTPFLLRAKAFHLKTLISAIILICCGV